jgi:hypothetical protein
MHINGKPTVETIPGTVGAGGRDKGEWWMR